MAEDEKKEQTPEREQDRSIKDMIKDMLGLGGEEENTQPPGADGQVISPVNIDKLLEVLQEIPLEDTDDREWPRFLRSESKRVQQVVEALSTEMVLPSLRDGLARIYHPIHGDGLVWARVSVAASFLREAVIKNWNQIIDALEASTLSSEDFSKLVSETTLASKLALLVLIELVARYGTLYFVNAPPKQRPPLVNAALGYELVR